MRRFGLIGFPLSHSFSQGYFTQKFKKENISDAVYENFPLENIDDFEKLLKNHPDLVGLNVTIPYKEKIIPYLQDLSKVAREIEAVNTIKFEKDSEGKLKLTGYNTDSHGFEMTIKPYLECHHKKALILGTGGASKAIVHVLHKLGLQCFYVSRNPGEHIFKTYKELTADDVAEFKVIVNTSPVGMYPNEHEYPDIPYAGIGSQHIIYDLIYNPEETIFLSNAKEKGAIAINGLEMLHLQAEKAWEIWNS